MASRLTELIEADRCRLHPAPLVQSDPVVIAGSHQALWQLHLGLQAEAWMEASAADTFNLQRLRQGSPPFSPSACVAAGRGAD